MFGIAGGVPDDNGEVREENFKAVQIGWPSGGCLTKEYLDILLGFDSLKKVGAMIGSGGLVVMNKHNCMVNVSKFFMQFTQNESCGKCVLCREGTRKMPLMLTDTTKARRMKILSFFGTACQNCCNRVSLWFRKDCI
ncbi:hypothetical protein AGMMS49921_01880 [Endomicrobiia bacterium]|nr:hypothetical protein AGMMS49921_01880 [Endomicrobiia bacterium]